MPLFPYSWLSAHQSMRCWEIPNSSGKSSQKFKFGESIPMMGMGKFLSIWSPMAQMKVSLCLKKHWGIMRYYFIIILVWKLSTFVLNLLVWFHDYNFVVFLLFGLNIMYLSSFLSNSTRSHLDFSALIF